MKILGYFIGLAVFSSILGENCDHLGVLLYEDLGCTPEYGEDKACPIRYTCINLEPSHDLCYYKGQPYQVGKFLEDVLTTSSCNKKCICKTSNEEKAFFDCTQLYCFERDLTEGCYEKYSHNECCSPGFDCPPLKDIHKCTTNGTEYNEGALLPPPETSCVRCICDKGFEGKYEEPFCKRVNCGVQLNEKGRHFLKKWCAPYYWEKSGKKCCPDDWICAEGREKIIGDVKREDVCKFGATTLKVGQHFEKHLEVFGSEKKVICECALPPLLTCQDEEE